LTGVWGGALAPLITLLLPSAVAADSFTPVQIAVQIAPVARLHQPLRTTVTVTADAGALDLRDGAVIAEVKLAQECGGVFSQTPGTTLVDDALTPQPGPGEPYTGSIARSGRPQAYGVMTVCVWIVDANEGRLFANSEDLTIDVSKPCTASAAAYDLAARRARRARGASRAAAAHRAAVARRTAAKACGPGVPL
jgi:hypothetical protein